MSQTYAEVTPSDWLDATRDVRAYRKAYNRFYSSGHVSRVQAEQGLRSAFADLRSVLERASLRHLIERRLSTAVSKAPPADAIPSEFWDREIQLANRFGFSRNQATKLLRPLVVDQDRPVIDLPGEFDSSRRFAVARLAALRGSDWPKRQKLESKRALFRGMSLVVFGVGTCVTNAHWAEGDFQALSMAIGWERVVAGYHVIREYAEGN